MALAIAETHEPLRPRNISVPSYRPTQPGGCTFAVRQFASGSGGRGSTRPPGATIAACIGAGAGVQSTVEGLGGMAYVLLGVYGRSATSMAEHSSQAHPVSVQLGRRLTRSAHYPWSNVSRSKAFWRFSM
jgi:hypothetical protein